MARHLTGSASSELHELPGSFPHKAPKGYSYKIRKDKRNLLSIWLCHHRTYVYRDGNGPASTIWGFYDTKKQFYYSPINSTKQGDQVDIKSTTPYTAMQLNLNPLMQCLMSPS